MTLFWLVSAWLAGLTASPYLALHATQWTVLSALGLATLILVRRTYSARLFFALLVAATLGAGRAALETAKDKPVLTRYNDVAARVSVRGRVVTYPDERESYTGLTVDVQAIRTTDGSWTATAGRILARADPFTEWRYGQEVLLTGELETPPVFEDFSYQAYLARDNIHSLFQVEEGRPLATGGGNPFFRRLYALRQKAHRVVLRLFPEPEASLLSGILLGIESGISSEVRSAFDATGTTHIIAISGFNISIIAGIFVSFLGRWLGARRGALAAGMGIGVYTLLVGADAAVVRAALMGGISLLAQLVGRRGHGFASLAAAAFFMTALNPAVLGDVGFQLSFAATFGLLTYGERFRQDFERFIRDRFALSPSGSARLGGAASEYFLLTLAAQITTLPLIAYHFSRLSWISPLANLIILPVQPPVMILGGIAALAGMVWVPLGLPLAWLAWPFPAFTIRTVEGMAALPGASQTLAPLPVTAIAGIYLGIALLTVSSHGERHEQTDGDPNVGRWSLLLLVLGAATVIAWRAVVDLPDGRLHVTTLGLDRGAGLLLETPSGRQVLVDGGASSIELGEALDRRLSPTARRLDWIILTDTDEEQIGGVARLIERYKVGGALVAGMPRGGAYRKLAADLESTNRPVGRVESGTQLDLGKGATLEFVPVGEGQLGLWIAFERAHFLLVPSAGSGWTGSLSSGTPPATSVTVLMPPESGDASLSPPEDLLALSPYALILPVEPGNTRGLPPTSLLAAAEGRAVLRTDRHGWIKLSTDGQYLWTEVERQPESPLP